MGDAAKDGSSSFVVVGRNESIISNRKRCYRYANMNKIRVFQLEHYCAGRVGAKRRIETKRVTGERRSLGFDTLCYSTGAR